MGEGQRVYDPIRIAMDDESYRSNDGIMAMNDKVEEVIMKSVDKLMNKWYRKPEQEVILPQEYGCGDQGCDTTQQSPPDQKKDKPNIFSDLQVTQDAIASKPPGFSNSVNIAK